MHKPTTVFSAALISRSPEDVFDFGTTPRHWPQWHPTARAVSGATDHPLQEGGQVLEEDKFIFLRGRIRWTLQKRSAPALWVLDGIVEGIPLFHGTKVTITYTLVPKGGRTLLNREMAYRVPNLGARILDCMLFRRHNVKQSQLAVDQLKKALEDRRGAGPWADG